MGDNLLICDQFNNRVIETTLRGEIVWQYGQGPQNLTVASIIGPSSAFRIGKFTLITGSGLPPGIPTVASLGVIDNRVILVDESGRIVWQYGQFGKLGITKNLLNIPVYAVFIPLDRNRKCRRKSHNHDDHKSDSHGDGYENHHHDEDDESLRDQGYKSDYHGHHHDEGYRSDSSRHAYKNELRGHYLITDKGNNRIIRVNERGDIVWQYPQSDTAPEMLLNMPASAEFLCNKNYLIADEGNRRAIEVDHNFQVVRTLTAGGTLGECTHATRLHNGNTLLTDQTNNRSIEVDGDDSIVWQYITNAEPFSILDPQPTRSVRVGDCDTLICDYLNNRVIRIGPMNTIVGYYGLPLKLATGIINTNGGYGLTTTQLGLYGPSDARMI